MRENENLEEIFDRYVGLELLSRDWPQASAGAPDPSTYYAPAAEFWGEPLVLGVVGST